MVEEFRKLQENIAILREDIAKKDKKLDSYSKIIEELKDKLKSKLTQDQSLIRGLSSQIIHNPDNNISNNNSIIISDTYKTYTADR